MPLSDHSHEMTISYQVEISLNILYLIQGAGLVAASFIAIVPGYISRSVAGSYDNEGIAIFCMLLTYYLWIKSVKTGQIYWAALCSIAYFYMVGALTIQSSTPQRIIITVYSIRSKIFHVIILSGIIMGWLRFPDQSDSIARFYSYDLWKILS